MPKLDIHNRIIIPTFFREELSWKLPKTVYICYDNELDMIFITDKEFSYSNFVITTRSIDSKGRLSLPKECLKLINASHGDIFAFLMKENKIYIKKV